MEQQYNASPQIQQVRRLGPVFDTAVAAIILVLVSIESLMLVKLNYSTDLSTESRVTDRDSNALQHARSFRYFWSLPSANQESNFIP
jgi:hypothetical protein